MPSPKRILDRKTLYPGDMLIREGDYGDCAYYVQTGQVGVYKKAGADEILITVLPGNSIVGEMALIDNCRRSATVRCLETATVVIVNRSLFENKIELLDPFMRALLEMFSQKIRRLNEDYCGIEQKLQWLLRQTGLPPLSPQRRWGKPESPIPRTLGAHPESTTTSRRTNERDNHNEKGAEEDIDRFDQVKLELSMLYHPDCIRERSDETLTRANVFKEIWLVLKKIEEEYDTA